ncbi:hypothetical protein SAMN04488056_12517 [Cohaesibacter marisflavi]|uniref:Uncharacterized protein n=1 Tax=Cohaesibacter marisflavi TaxID=655353 RepID=A0A1I5N2S1_9HYPH|nr:hypothetical protein SAMN04488056_12517 [Cohaesibacter marisflavi]
MAVPGLHFAIIIIAKPALKHMIMLAAQRILNQVKPLIPFQTNCASRTKIHFAPIGKRNLIL